jgi:hypothetical protein
MYIPTRWQQGTPPAAPQCPLSALQLILLVLWPMKICFALSLFKFLGSNWFQVVPTALSGSIGGEIGSRCIGRASAPYSSGYRRDLTTHHPVPPRATPTTTYTVGGWTETIILQLVSMKCWHRNLLPSEDLIVRNKYTLTERGRPDPDPFCREKFRIRIQ